MTTASEAACHAHGRAFIRRNQAALQFRPARCAGTEGVAGTSPGQYQVAGDFRAACARRWPARPGPSSGRPSSGRPSPGTPWAGARRSVDGLAVAPGPGAPSSPTGSVMSDAMSAATDASYRRTFTSDSPITAFLRADAGLATAANNYAPGGANGSNLAAYAQNDPWNRADPLGLPSDQTQTAASQSSQNHGTSWQGVAGTAT